MLVGLTSSRGGWAARPGPLASPFSQLPHQQPKKPHPDQHFAHPAATPFPAAGPPG